MIPMSVVLALFIALSAGASEEEQILPPVEDASCAQKIQYPDTLKDIVERLRALGVIHLIRSYDDGTLLVRSPWRLPFRREVVGSFRTNGKKTVKRVLVLGELPYATEEDRNRATLNVAMALYHLELNARQSQNGILQDELGMIRVKLPEEASAEAARSGRPRLLRMGAAGLALTAIVGGGVYFYPDVRDHAKYWISQAGSFFRPAPTEQEQLERQVRELETAINSEQAKLFRADQEKIERDQARLNQIYQRNPELRRSR